MPLRDALLALAVMAVWGTNFVVIHVGLTQLPPLFFATLRFTFAALPLVFFLKRPLVPWKNLAAFGLAISIGPSGLLFIAMKGYISPGLASLLIQAQAFFTIGFAIWRHDERLTAAQIFAMMLAVAGIAVIAAHHGEDTTVIGVALVLGAAFLWAVSNQLVREAGPIDIIAYIAWSSLAVAPAMLVLSLLFDGWPAIRAGITGAHAAAWAAALWQGLGNSLFGYGLWAWLLRRHPAATVAPLTLLVPVFGMGASALLLGESLPGWKLAGAALVMGGIAVNLLWRRRRV